MIVQLNGKKIGEFAADTAGMKDYVVDVPPNSWNGKNTLVLELPNAASPLSLGINNDSRVLGLAMKSLSVKKK